MTLNFYFDDGFHGTLTNDNPGRIRELIEIFCNPEAMKELNIVSITLSQNGSENILREAA